MKGIPRILRAVLILSVLLLFGIFILKQSEEYYQDVNSSILNTIIAFFGYKILANTRANLVLDVNYVGPRVPVK
jgi:hypothetical protein